MKKNNDVLDLVVEDLKETFAPLFEQTVRFKIGGDVYLADCKISRRLFNQMINLNIKYTQFMGLKDAKAKAKKEQEILNEMAIMMNSIYKITSINDKKHTGKFIDTQIVTVLFITTVNQIFPRIQEVAKNKKEV